MPVELLLLLHLLSRRVHIMVVEYLRVPVKALLAFESVSVRARGDIHHDLPSVHWQIGVVEAPVELLLSHGLIGGVMVRGEVVVRERLGGRYSLLGVEDEHPLQEVDSRRVGILKLVLQGLPLALGERLDEAEGLRGG